MLPYFWYILKVIICSGILFGYYWLFLRNKIFHQYNRFYLLGALVLSLSLPMLKIDFWQQNDPQQSQVIKALQVVSAGDEYMNNVIITASTGWNIQQVYTILYWAISLIFCLVLLRTLFVIRSLLKKYPVQIVDKFSFVNTEDKSTPFSFLKYIFWNANIDMDTTTGKQIFKHEVAHIQERHTYDKLFINATLILFWCNPFFWLYRKELNMIHEFIADKKAVEDCDTAAFAEMILQATYPQHRFQLANNFFYSPIKRRLLMLTKKNNPRLSYVARLMVLPLAVLVFAAFSFKAKNSSHLYHGKKITVVIDAGHGGKDHGAKSADGILEKDLTLAIVKKIQDLNSNNAIEIILTRDEDVYMNPMQKIEFTKSKKADLFISFHIDNSLKQNEKSGVSFFVARDQFANTEESKVLATSLINEFTGNYGLNVSPAPQQKSIGIWTLQANDIPAVIVEAGYMTNAKDVAYLQTNEAKNAIAKNVLTAIEKFANSITLSKTINNKISTTDTILTSTYINTKHAGSKYLNTDEYKNKALVIIDSKEIGNVGYNYIENGNMIYSSIVIYNPVEARKIYDAKGRYGVIKLTQKDALSVTADSVFYDEKTQSIKLSGTNTAIKGDLSSSLIYIDGKIATPAELNAIPPNKISSVNVLKGEKIDEIINVKGKTSLINVSLKPDDLQEVIIRSDKIPKKPAVITLGKMNVFYIGMDNPITINAGDLASPEDLVASVSAGKIQGINGKYIVKVTQPGEIILTLSKRDGTELPGRFTFIAKRLPDPSDPDFPNELLEEIKSDTNIRRFKLNQKLLQEQQLKLKSVNTLNEKIVPGQQIENKKLFELKQDLNNIQVEQAKTALFLKSKNTLNEQVVLGQKLKNQNLLNEKIALQQSKVNLTKAEKDILEKTTANLKAKIVMGTQLESQDLLKAKQNLQLIELSKVKLDESGKALLNESKEMMLAKVVEEQKELLKLNNNKVFTIAEVSPQFTGGDEAWKKYLQKNIKPIIPLDEGWSAGTYTVIVKFIVLTDGSVIDVTAENYKGTKTAWHCIEVIKNAPKWQPAIQNGHKVNAYKKQPITFVIEEQK